MKSKTILILLVVVAVSIIAALLQHSSEAGASKVIYVIAPARGEFQRLIESDPRYSMLQADFIGSSGRVIVRSTGQTRELDQMNLDAGISSLIEWGFTWQKKRISKEELAVVHLAGAVQDYDPRDRPGKIANAVSHIIGRLRDVASR